MFTLTYFVVLFILSPYPSLFILFLDYYNYIPFKVILNLFPPLLLGFVSFSSLIVCCFRDPGAPRPLHNDENDSVDYAPPDPLRWCSKCIAPKPERAHHCSTCDRCHRTQPAFVHFLTGCTFLASYVAVLGSYYIYSYLYNPFILHEHTTFHALFLAIVGVIFALVVGSFLGYHIYLILTNQTTIEQISYYHLLSYLPVIPATPECDTVYPPNEHQLSYSQRRFVREAHNNIRIYDIGYKQNYCQVFTNNPLWHRVWFGGRPSGDGHSFPRNTTATERLAALAAALRNNHTDDL